MTKTEYRQYISSPEWQKRRKEFLAHHSHCERCLIPRWLAEIAYDQDLNIHHKAYENLGNEDDDDLEALCRRCHEIDKFRRSDLREPKYATCAECNRKHWNPYSSMCDICDWYTRTASGECCKCGRILPYSPDDLFICQTCHDIEAGTLPTWKSELV